jgi:hypothetical protein
MAPKRTLTAAASGSGPFDAIVLDSAGQNIRQDSDGVTLANNA